MNVPIFVLNFKTLVPDVSSGNHVEASGKSRHWSRLMRLIYCACPPNALMIFAIVAEKQLEADVLRAEITALKDSSAQTWAMMDALQRVADDVSKDRDLVQPNLEANGREMEQMVEAHAQECSELHGDPPFEAEKASAEKAMHNDRKSIAQNLARMIQIIQINRFPTCWTEELNSQTHMIALNKKPVGDFLVSMI
ncbi:hypothetical protein C8R44DRAFT_742714 [Mycena epipterygia]|nr:hypothetical protein C8R44DRAFT_742714 [Mycena epipterygia]